MSAPPDDSILQAWGAAGARAESVADGLINQTWIVHPDGALALVVQRLHPIFGAAVNADIDAVTRHLAARGVRTPRVVATASGALWVEADGGIYRALSFEPGATIHRIGVPVQAESAGQTVGRFHAALADFAHDYQFTRSGVHDTPGWLARLEACAAVGGDQPAAVALAGDILAAAAALPPLADSRRRHCHGDLKISNVRFADDRTWAPGCLVDLDTVGLQTIAYELGDAMRSWCNPRGEDVEAPELDLGIFERALAGYAATAAGLLEPAEVASIAPGTATVALELAARFCVNVFEDSYFAWDASRFASRREHNLLRARGQLSLARSAITQLADATASARRALET